MHSTAREYDVSARLVCEKLGIELRELKDWTCCGASSAHSTDHLLSIALPSLELQAAEEMELPLVVACAMCYSSLKFAAHELADEVTLNSVKEIIGKDFSNTTEVAHLLTVLDNNRENIPAERQLDGLKVACYYGCLLVRPRDIVNLDDEENPQIMDRLMEALGAQTLDWGFKTECCGASLPFARPDIVLKLSHRLLLQAKQQGHINLDTRQKEMRAEYKDDFSLPVLYFTQLLGLSLGFSPKQLLLNRHFTDPLPILREKGLI